MENKQTAVEYLEEKLKGDKIFSLDIVLKKAKLIEKQQIKDAWKDTIWHRSTEEVLEYNAEKYYNETYERESKESN